MKKLTKKKNFKGQGVFSKGIKFFLAIVVFSLVRRGESVSFSQEKSPLLVTNVFYDTDIREALRDISAQVGIPLILDPTVSGTVTIELNNVPLEKCLEMILLPGGYTFRKMDGYYLIGSALPTSPTFDLLAKTELIKPKYIKASDIPVLLSDFYRDYIQVNKNTNTLTITASPPLLKRIKEEIALIDVPPSQIMVEAVVTEISKDALEELGVNWQWQFRRGYASIKDFTGELYYYTTGKFPTQFWTALRLMIEQGKASLKANPRIATLEGKEAVINIGKEEYHLIEAGTPPYPYRTLEAIKAGIVLKIVPYISGKDEVTLRLNTEVSDIVGKGVEGLPLISKRAATTNVRVKDGETVVIGGLLEKNRRRSTKKVPLLGALPGIGTLFRSQRIEEEDNELVIFVTPHIWKKESSYPQETKNYSLANYKRKIYEMIYRKIKANSLLAKQKGEAQCCFTLTPQGEVKDVEVKVTKGDRTLAKELKKCLYELIPYPVFPSHLPQERSFYVEIKLGEN